MSACNLYPVFLSLNGKKCLLAGLGKVGCRKLATLLSCDISSMVILDPAANLLPEAMRLLQDQRVEFFNRSFEPDDLNGCFMVFAATNSPEENMRIAKLCEIKNILCNSATNPKSGNFFVPSVINAEYASLAISSKGISPALTAEWRKELSTWLASQDKIAWLIGKIRTALVSIQPNNPENREILRELVHSQVKEWLENGNIDKCRSWLKTKLPISLHPLIERIFSEYRDVFS